MANDITNSVNAIIAKYIDPQTKKPFNKDNPDINTNIKDGHVNVSININPIHNNCFTKYTKVDVLCLLSGVSL